MSFLFLNQNFIDLDVVANNFVSSEQSAFPIINVYNKQRRSKLWRSNGYWEITSLNNQIVFEETNAVPLTATIAVDEYNSDTLFFAALKAALEDVGASTYTVTRDVSTLKIKITSNGAGGGGILNLRWTNVGSTAATILGFDTAFDSTGALTYTADVLRIHTNEWIKWDMGISTNPQAFCLIGPRNTPIRITPSATIKLQGNETDNWTVPSYETTLTYGDSIISTFNDSGLHTEGLRYWRALFTDASNPLGFVEVGSVFLGDYYKSTRGQPQFPFRTIEVDRSETIFSEGGQTFSEIREKTERFQVDYFGLTIAEKEALVDIFDEFGTSVPLFISYDPNGVFTSVANLMCRYVKFEAEPSIDLVSPGNFRMSLQFREEL